jgi:serine/threonine-protein kinase
MNEALPQAFSPGQIITGKYRIERVLGQGGMGVVLAAQHIQLEERVAIKLMLGDAATGGEAVARFVREARAAARLESTHVAKVSDVGTLEGGQPYMVMEYLDGQDLAQVLQTSGPLPLQQAVDCVLQASEAITEAHSLGIIHRDLKPSNLFLMRRRDRRLHVKVLDFGISKVVSATRSGSEHAMTRTSALMGTPLYMSPEQMTSVKSVDARSDIWALGVILFELLTGSQPFVGDTLPEVCGLVIQSADPPASSRRPDLPPEIDAVIHRCLQKAPADRFQSVAEFAFALQALAGRDGHAALERISVLSGGPDARPLKPASLVQHTSPVSSANTGTPSANTGTPSANPSTQAAWGETSPGAHRSRRNWLLLPLVGVPALAAAAWFALGSRSEPAPGLSSSAALSQTATAVSPPPATQQPEVVVAPVPSLPAVPPPTVSAMEASATPEPVPARLASPRTRAGATKKKAKEAPAPGAPAKGASVAAAVPATPPPAVPVAPPAAKPSPPEAKPNDLGGRL